MIRQKQEIYIENETAEDFTHIDWLLIETQYHYCIASVSMQLMTTPYDMCMSCNELKICINVKPSFEICSVSCIVTVPVYTRKSNGSRNYQKLNYCFFCETKYSSKIAQHYLSVHTDKAEVQEIIALPVLFFSRNEETKSITPQ